MSFATAQPTGQGSRIWEETLGWFSQSDHYQVIFTYARQQPMARNIPMEGEMLYSRGRYHVVLPELEWYYDGETQWEYLMELQQVTRRHQPDPMALSPVEVLRVLTLQPVSVTYGGSQTVRGVECERIRLNFQGRDLPYESAMIWVDQQRQPQKVVFLDRFQVSTSIDILQIRPVDTPPVQAFRFPEAEASQVRMLDQR